jgi:hypothetical protein
MTAKVLPGFVTAQQGEVLLMNLNCLCETQKGLKERSDEAISKQHANLQEIASLRSQRRRKFFPVLCPRSGVKCSQ